ncbi:MAG: inositol monophosphatase, partial [Candidatus Omnitrophica bacterium]|nr:inositol monophosphatase [Candidatus Omnitrophota bacterium]
VGRVGKVSYKGRDNIVTDIDKASEKMIIGIIKSKFPDHSILAEEGSSDATESPYKWIIDPLDGTTNFAHGFPFFCVSIALEKFGKVVLGVVYDPVRRELFCAESGKGAYLNNRRISVSMTRRLSQSFLATGFSYGKARKDKNVRNFKNLLMRSLAIRRAGSAALDLCYVACGRFDGFWEMYLQPWDSAAGAIIVEEADGMATKFDGSKFFPYHKNILATNGLIHRQMSRLLRY